MNIITNKNGLYTTQYSQLISVTVSVIIFVAVRALAYQTTNIYELSSRSNLLSRCVLDNRYLPNRYCYIEGFADGIIPIFLAFFNILFPLVINGKRVSNAFEKVEKSSDITPKEKLDAMLTLAFEHHRNSTDFASSSMKLSCLDTMKAMSKDPSEQDTINSLWKKAMKLVETNVDELSYPMCEIVLNSTKIKSTGDPLGCIPEPGIYKNIYKFLSDRELTSLRLVSKCFCNSIGNLMVPQMIDHFLKMIEKCTKDKSLSGFKSVAETLIAIIHKTIDNDFKRSKRMIELVCQIVNDLEVVDDDLVTRVKELELRI